MGFSLGREGAARGSLLDERFTRTSRASALYTIRITIENYFSTEFYGAQFDAAGVNVLF
jgi:hypothetical protein